MRTVAPAPSRPQRVNDPPDKWPLSDGPIAYAAGIVCQFSPTGEFLRAAVYDAEEFAAAHGADLAATDENAAEIASWCVGVIGTAVGAAHLEWVETTGRILRDEARLP